MKDRYFFLITLVISILVFVLAVIFASVFTLETKEDWKDYDNYILSLYWAPTFCYNKQSNLHFDVQSVLTMDYMV